MSQIYERLYQDVKTVDKLHKKKHPKLYSKKTLKKTQVEYLRKYINEGDIESRNAIVKSNLKICTSEAKKYTDFIKSPHLFDDLVSCAFMESINCLERFKLDHQEGEKISNASLTSWIKNSVSFAFSKFMTDHTRNVKIQPSYTNKCNIELAAKEEYAQKYMQHPKNGERYVYKKSKRVKVFNKEKGVFERKTIIEKIPVVFGKNAMPLNHSIDCVNSTVDDEKNFSTYIENQMVLQSLDNTDFDIFFDEKENSDYQGSVLNSTLREILNEDELIVYKYKYVEGYSNTDIKTELKRAYLKKCSQTPNGFLNTFEIVYNNNTIEKVNIYNHEYYDKNDIHNKQSYNGVNNLTMFNGSLRQLNFLKDGDKYRITSDEKIKRIYLNGVNVTSKLKNNVYSSTKNLLGFIKYTSYNVTRINERLINKLRKNDKIYELWETM